jgi:hypothetical protein
MGLYGVKELLNPTKKRSSSVGSAISVDSSVSPTIQSDADSIPSDEEVTSFQPGTLKNYAKDHLCSSSESESSTNSRSKAKKKRKLAQAAPKKDYRVDKNRPAPPVEADLTRRALLNCVYDMAILFSSPFTALEVVRIYDDYPNYFLEVMHAEKEFRTCCILAGVGKLIRDGILLAEAGDQALSILSPRDPSSERLNVDDWALESMAAPFLKNAEENAGNQAASYRHPSNRQVDCRHPSRSR